MLWSSFYIIQCTLYKPTIKKNYDYIAYAPMIL